MGTMILFILAVFSMNYVRTRRAKQQRQKAREGENKQIAIYPYHTPHKL